MRSAQQNPHFRDKKRKAFENAYDNNDGECIKTFRMKYIEFSRKTENVISLQKLLEIKINHNKLSSISNITNKLFKFDFYERLHTLF